VRVGGNEGEELGKGNRPLAEGKMVSLFGGEVVQVNTDETRGKAAQMLGVVDQAK
jgi:hypothetical protein